ncbi:hypothetical protein NMG60_11030773 [Bertholletia excelsa]
MEVPAKLCSDLSGKMKLSESDGELTEVLGSLGEEVEDIDSGDDDDFSFAYVGSPISAEDIFLSGQTSTVFPLFDQSLLLDADSANSEANLPSRPPVNKVFVQTEEANREATGPYCQWTGKAIEASGEGCKKSNSTGFSKTWRFRDLLGRSTSDGKDAFVFLNGGETTTSREESSQKMATACEANAKAKVGDGAPSGVKGKAKEGGRAKTASLSAHEQYMRNRVLRMDDRRRSYLPYRPELVGFFTNVQGGLSRNVHPF